MSSKHVPSEDIQAHGRYEIRIKGHLDSRWADQFEDMSFARDGNGTTLLSGPVVDQAALHGLLRKVRDLGLTLVSVVQVDPESDLDHSNTEKTNVDEKGRASKQAGLSEWLVPAALLLLGAVPLIAGAFRLTELFGGAAVLPADERFHASPLPVILHILGATAYTLLGPLQFAPGFRRRRPGWHLAAGKILVLSGLAVGLSALWMTLFYPRQAGTGELLYGLRLLFGSAMVASILLGVAAIRRGDLKRHRAWMARGYAIGLGAGTQVLTLTAGEFVSGSLTEFSHALLMGAGWAINLAVAEWAIHKKKGVGA